jgi:hypothetical protein
MSGPTESRKITLAVICIQTISGSRHTVIPGARMLIAVVRKFTPPIRNEANSSASATSQRLIPQNAPVYAGTSDSGTYPVHPAGDAPPGTKKELSSTIAATKSVHTERRLSRGNAMSGAPTISGIRKLPIAPSKRGIATKNTMIVPCIVTNALYASGPTNPHPATGFSGHASCARIR